MNLEDDISTCLILFYDYVEENPTSVILPDFEQTMTNEIGELIHNDKEEEYIEDVIDISLEIFDILISFANLDDILCLIILSIF